VSLAWRRRLLELLQVETWCQRFLYELQGREQLVEMGLLLLRVSVWRELRLVETWCQRFLYGQVQRI